MIDNGVHGTSPFCTNGEGYILSAEEKKLVLEVVVDQTVGRVSTYTRSGTIFAKETIVQSKMAQAVGADVLSIIMPSFAAASQEEVNTHYKAVAKALDIPNILYIILTRTGDVIHQRWWRVLLK